MSDYFDQALREDLKELVAAGRLKLSLDVEHYFSLMKTLLPIRNLRPDWQQMPFLVTEVAEHQQDKTALFRAFFERVVHEFRLSAEAVYVGDSCTDIAVLGDTAALMEVSGCLFSIPQHHYVLAADQSWVMCLTLEGDMGFGFLRK